MQGQSIPSGFYSPAVYSLNNGEEGRDPTTTSVYHSYNASAAGAHIPSPPPPTHDKEEINSSETPWDGSVSKLIDPVKWLRGGWSLYRENWLSFSGFQLLVLALNFLLPLVFLAFRGSKDDDDMVHTMGHSHRGGAHEELMMDVFYSIVSLLTWPLYTGHLFVGLSVLRAKVYGSDYSMLDEANLGSSETTGKAPIRFHHFLNGYFLYFPLLALSFVHALLLLLGFFCLIVPGVYLMVVLAFVELLYIEYHHSLANLDRHSTEPQPFSFWQSFTVSVERVHPHFWRVGGFLLVLLAINYVGLLTIFGTIFTIPFTSLCLVMAFEDLFGLKQTKVIEHTCIFSC